MNLYHRIVERFLEDPDQIFLDWPGKTLKRSDVLLQSSGIARYLQGRVSRQSHIGVFCVPSPHLSSAFLGVMAADCVLVPLNPLLSPAEMRRFLDEAHIELVLAEGEALSKLAAQGVAVMDISEERPVNLSPIPLPDSANEDDAWILMTSGTSRGQPTGVRLSHRALLHNAMSIEKAFEIGEKDVFLGVLPYFHCFALMVNFVVPALCGSRIRALAQFRSQDVLEEIRSGVTIAALVPAMFKAILTANPDSSVFSGIRYFISGGEAMPEQTLKAFHALTGQFVAQGYGMTEHSPVIAVDRSRELQFQGTVGRPLDGVEIVILPTDGEAPKPFGVTGEVAVRSQSLMSGYLGLQWDHRLTRDGYFRTGDLGYLREDGALVLTGRLKELIISAGENIHPMEIESVLQGFEGLHEVVCVGIPSQLRGEEPALLLSPKTVNVSKVRSWLRAQLPSFKCPRVIRAFASLPRTATGKHSRSQLRQFLLEEENGA